jgi:hypothetical protein
MMRTVNYKKEGIIYSEKDKNAVLFQFYYDRKNSDCVNESFSKMASICKSLKFKIKQFLFLQEN